MIFLADDHPRGQSETFHIPVPAANLPAATAHDPLWVPSAHGHDGPVKVSYSQYISPQMQGFFESFRQEGLYVMPKRIRVQLQRTC